VLLTFCRAPELFLDEMADAVNDIAARVEGAVEVAPATVARVLRRNGYMRKVVERAFITRKEANRVSWVVAQWRIPLRCREYVDESHGVERVAERRWASSLRGARSESYVTSPPGVRTSLFLAMSHDELLDWMMTCIPSGQTSVDFLLFMTSVVLPRMSAAEKGGEWARQPERCILVFDNANVHDEVALATVRDAGMVVLLLPPYSPDFNLIEDVFSGFSSWLRRYSRPEHFNAWPMLTINSMLADITGDMCRELVKVAVCRYEMYVP